MLRKLFDPALEELATLARSLGATMAFQSQANVEVKYKPEGTFAVIAAAGAGAKRFRSNGGGLGLTMAEIMSNELRPDLKSSMLRYGTKNVDGSYPGDLSVGTFDDLIEAVMRGTWTAASAITAATFTTLAPAVTTGNSGTFTAAAGSFLTQGFRVGQIVRRTGSALAANNGRNLRVTGVTASLLTFTTSDNLPITGGAADGTGTLDIQKRIIQPAAGGIIRRSFTFEEYQGEIDQSEVYTGGRVSTMRLSGAPDAMAVVEFGIVGADLVPQTTANSPYFTNPTISPSIALTLADASLRFGGADVTSLTGIDFTLDNRQQGQGTIGNKVTPDVFEGAAQLRGTISGLRSDLTNVSRYLAETELELHALMVEPEAEPKDYISVFIPRIKLGRPTKSTGAGGGMIETLPWTAGDKEVVTGYDDTMIQIETSAP